MPEEWGGQDPELNNGRSDKIVFDGASENDNKLYEIEAEQEQEKEIQNQIEKTPSGNEKKHTENYCTVVCNDTIVQNESKDKSKSDNEENKDTKIRRFYLFQTPVPTFTSPYPFPNAKYTSN